MASRECSLLQLLQDLCGDLSDVLPGKLDMLRLCCAATHSKPQHKTVCQVTWDHVDLSAIVYCFKEFFIQCIGSLQSEAHESQDHITTDLKAFVLTYQAFKLMGKAHMLSNVFL